MYLFVPVTEVLRNKLLNAHFRAESIQLKLVGVVFSCSRYHLFYSSSKTRDYLCLIVYICLPSIKWHGLYIQWIIVYTVRSNVKIFSSSAIAGNIWGHIYIITIKANWKKIRGTQFLVLNPLRPYISNFKPWRF